MNAQDQGRLRREAGVGGAVLIGLGSVVGTGVYVSTGIAAGIAGPAVLLAIGIAAAVATCNGLSSAQLAASHPVSGGTYEYGHEYLTPTVGFVAGLAFLLAKTASAATAALGFSGYLTGAIGLPPSWNAAVAVAATAVLTLIVAGGVRRTNRANLLIVGITLAALAFFVVAGLPSAAKNAKVNLIPFFPPESGMAPLLHATALMFVAFTGYGRVATMGEEVKNPAHTIPRAVIATLIVSALLYASVAAVAVAAAGTDVFAETANRTGAPLEWIARSFAVPGAAWVLAAGGVIAMLSVLLNLILGLSRVVLAMGRRGDLPGRLATVDKGGATPTAAVVVTGVAVALLALLGDIRTTWSFSAFTVLVYYGITNLAALRIPKKKRRFPRWVAVLGLVSCFFLAFWVETAVWLTGAALLAAGLAARALYRRFAVL